MSSVLIFKLFHLIEFYFLPSRETTLPPFQASPLFTFCVTQNFRADIYMSICLMKSNPKSEAGEIIENKAESIKICLLNYNSRSSKHFQNSLLL